MNSGEIVVEHTARKFRVYPRESRALKDLVVARGRTRGTDVWALRDVSFSVGPGHAVGLVGRNGSGKTTLLRLLSGIIKPTSGRVAVGGRVGSLLELGAGFHPDLTGRENVFLNGSIYGLRRVAIREKFDEIVAFAGLEDFIDLPVRTYSSGMYMRLGFAIASHIEADVLLLDEVFAVGDEAFQRKCFGKIFEFKQRGGTIIFVSHDASAVERLCDRAVLLSEGLVAFDGPTHEAVVAYRRLLAGERDPEERAAGLKEWGGEAARVEHVRLRSAAPRLGAARRRRHPRCLGRRDDRRARLERRYAFAATPLRGRASAVHRRPAPPASRHRRRHRRHAVPLHRRRARLRRLPGRRGTRARPSRRNVVVSSRTCPDWPDLMEIAPELQFKHYTVAELQLPADALMRIPGVPLSDVAICCDLEHNVFYAAHTDERVADALRSSHWFEVREWIRTGRPGQGY